MKLILALMLCAVVAAVPKTQELNQFEQYAIEENTDASRNILVNALIRQFFTYIRYVINNGSAMFGLPPLDPLEMDHIQISLPTGLVNVDLEMKEIFGAGIGGFVVHRSNLNLRELSFDLEISVPRLDISTEHYDLLGDFVNAIPLYGKGKASFLVEGFRFQAKLYLKQSENEKSVIVDRVENIRFEIPTFKSNITGVVGGGDIDAIVNAMAEEVIIDYVNRFQGAIGVVAAHAIVPLVNPVLEQLDTWRFLAPLIPRN